MRDFSPFIFFYIFIVSQRFIELIIAKKNEKWMLRKGAVEFGMNNYRYIVIVHFLFFICFFAEKTIGNRGLSPVWQWYFLFFVILQLGRVWAILSLGKYWNTKILVLPNARVIRKGPYRFIRHPNYAVVTFEFLMIPLLFSSYLTAALFNILNIAILSVRIPEEEKALKKLTEYEGEFHNCNRFLPKFLSKCDS